MQLTALGPTIIDRLLVLEPPPRMRMPWPPSPSISHGENGKRPIGCRPC